MASDSWLDDIPPPTSHSIRIWVDDKDTTLDLEGNAIHAMNRLPATAPARALWEWSTSLDTKIPSAPESHSTLQKMLGEVDISNMKGEHLRAAEQLTQLPLTSGFIHGGPGTGKSKLMRDLAVGLMDNGIRQIFWIAPQNSLLNDMAKKFRQDRPDKLIIRLRPIQAEIKVVVNDAMNKFRLNTDAAPDCERLLAMSLNRMKNDQDRDSIPNSLIHSIATTTDAHLRERWRFLVSHRDSEFDNKDELTATVRKLLLKHAAQADIILATPASIAQYINTAKSQQPTFIFTDDVGRMTEILTWLVLSKCPHAPAIQAGDIKQSKPITRAYRGGIPTVFDRQRAISLLERLTQLEHIDVTLKDNHRVQGNVHAWAQMYFYRDEMNVINNEMSPANRRASDDFMTTVFGYVPRSNLVFVDMTETRETQVGVTWKNADNAEFVIETAVQMYSAFTITFGRKPSVLINTPYAAQKLELQGRFKSVQTYKVDKNMFRIMTVDAASNRYADIIFTDLV